MTLFPEAPVAAISIDPLPLLMLIPVPAVRVDLVQGVTRGVTDQEFSVNVRCLSGATVSHADGGSLPSSRSDGSHGW